MKVDKNVSLLLLGEKLDFGCFSQLVLAAYVLACFLLLVFVLLACLHGKQWLCCCTASVSKTQSHCLFRIAAFLPYTDNFDGWQMTLFLLYAWRAVSDTAFAIGTLSFLNAGNGSLAHRRLICYASVLILAISHLYDICVTVRHITCVWRLTRKDKVVDGFSLVATVSDRADTCRTISPTSHKPNSVITLKKKKKKEHKFNGNDESRESDKMPPVSKHNALVRWIQEWKCCNLLSFAVLLLLFGGNGALALCNTNAFNAQMFDLDITPKPHLYRFYGETMGARYYLCLFQWLPLSVLKLAFVLALDRFHIVTLASLFASLLILYVNGAMYIARHKIEEYMCEVFCGDIRDKLRAHIVFSFEVNSEDLCSKAHSGMRRELAQEFEALISKCEDKEAGVLVHIHRIVKAHQRQWCVYATAYGPRDVLYSFEKRFDKPLLQNKMGSAVNAVFGTKKSVQVTNCFVEKPCASKFQRGDSESTVIPLPTVTYQQKKSHSHETENAGLLSVIQAESHLQQEKHDCDEHSDNDEKDESGSDSMAALTTVISEVGSDGPKIGITTDKTTRRRGSIVVLKATKQTTAADARRESYLQQLHAEAYATNSDTNNPKTAGEFEEESLLDTTGGETLYARTKRRRASASASSLSLLAEKAVESMKVVRDELEGDDLQKPGEIPPTLSSTWGIAQTKKKKRFEEYEEMVDEERDAQMRFLAATTGRVRGSSHHYDLTLGDVINSSDGLSTSRVEVAVDESD